MDQASFDRKKLKQALLEIATILGSKGKRSALNVLRTKFKCDAEVVNYH